MGMPKPVAEERTLVERAREGDKSAFECLYNDNVDAIRGLCVRLTADVVLGDELCQRTFIRAWQQLPKFRGESGLSTWLHRIAVTQTLMEQRSDSRRRGRVLPMPTTTVNLRGELLDLERAIATLPTGARTVFVLHDVEGYRHAEVADLLGITVGTCKGQLHRARRLLRLELNR